ncbi:MAG: hypothetical protein F6K40_15215 [Okeania sp. SIO3I5]|uniref:hypothetical protein n=1 Tax=Okeania sp. SIO3I5 TaxID=2607805 RepID=UPI0013B8F9FB|nr:hypothetical protein [Okeania sp. SIO3I5]NEQ37545.1 hypothetical protein [Okeania sp. SIO3I5]
MIGKISLPELKAKSGFFPTAEISEVGKRKIGKIPHFPQPKISNCHRYIYIDWENFIARVKGNIKRSLT